MDLIAWDGVGIAVYDLDVHAASLSRPTYLRKRVARLLSPSVAADRPSLGGARGCGRDLRDQAPRHAGSPTRTHRSGRGSSSTPSRPGHSPARPRWSSAAR